MSVVVCRLPQTGLGNQLFPLLKAHLFASINNLPIQVVGYNQVKIGPYLRGDRSKRNYKGYFTFEKNVVVEQIAELMLLRYRHYAVIAEPRLHKLVEPKANQLYLFKKLPHWSDYFHELKDHRRLVMELFTDLLSPAIKKQWHRGQAPVIGVHVRMGDFRKLKAGEDFSKVGVVRTPVDYFIEVINGIRTIHGSNLPVSVFTDGYKSELEQLLSLADVQVVEGNADIVDLLLLSRSRIIVTSTGSTFSYWAGFLSDAALIMHPDHIHQSIRPVEIGKTMYEGAFDAGNISLVENIRNIPV